VKPLHIFNTLSRTVEEFSPAKPPIVTFYSCGPTVYLPQHLGNMRAYVFIDTLTRVLAYDGYDVRHVMNITDVGHMTSDEDAGEDKIEKTARAEGKSPLEIANHYLALFHDDCAKLNIEPPTVECRATDHIPEMVALIEKIIARGYAYVTASGVYFDVEKWRGPSRMGRLSRQSLDEQHTGQRLEHSPDKHSPHDFALWVLNQPHHMMQWESPWGRGYPGWHIECSAMSMKYLGATLDIHSGGLDHIPVHHENEIAQSESATGQPFVRYFVHNAFLVGMEGAKISKSAGRFPVLADLSNAGINPIAFRWLCLMVKYRSELRFSVEVIRAAENSLSSVTRLLANLPLESKDYSDSLWVASHVDAFDEAINDDLNTPRAVATFIEMVKVAEQLNNTHNQRVGIWNAVRTFDRVFGIGLEEISDRLRVNSTAPDAQANAPSGQTQGLDAWAYSVAQARKGLRDAKRFKEADQRRDELLEAGYIVEDVNEKPGFRLSRRKKS
jgi:cysteinyl-tRNA synthetase